MESFAFELKLVSDVDRVANRGADALKKLDGKAKDTKRDLDFGKQYEKIAAQLHKLEKDPAGYTKMLKATKELAEQRKRLAEKAGLGKESFTEALGNKVSFGKMFGAAALADVLVEGGMKVGESLIEAAHAAIEVISEGVKKAFEESGKEEKRRRQFRLSLGGEEGKESLEDAERFSKMLKFTPEQVAPMLLKLRRAGFDQKSARQTIATGSDIEAAGGITAQEYAEFAEHLKLKGGVSKKQLVGAGINVPEFFKNLGKKLHISAEAAEKRAEEGGKIDPQLMLNQITEAVNKKQGGAAGTGGIQEAKGLEARWAKLIDLPNQFLKRFVDSPNYQRVSDMLGSLLEKLDPESESGKRIMASLDRMFDRVAGMIAGVDVDKVTDGFEDAISAAEGFLPVLTGLADAAGDLAGFALDAAQSFKLLYALQSGDKAGATQAAVEMKMRDARRAVRDQERDARKQGLGEGKGVLDPTRASDDDTNSPLAISYAASSRPASEGKGGKVININVHSGAVQAHHHGGDSPDRSHREAAEKLGKSVQRELEKAAQEGGG